MENINISYLGPLFKAARLSANLTQEELAERIGVTTRYIIALENEGKCPALQVFLKLTRTLNIPAQTLIYPESQLDDTETQQLIRMIQMLSSRDRHIIQATIQKMLEDILFL